LYPKGSMKDIESEPVFEFKDAFFILQVSLICKVLNSFQ